MPEHKNPFTRDQIFQYYQTVAPGLVRHGEQLRAPCPLHNGVRDSLSINIDSGCWTCHSECGAGNIFQFEAKLRGVETMEAAKSIAEFFGMEHNGKPAKKDRKWKYVCSYPYTDREGKLLYEVVRYEDELHPGDKSFRQRRPDPDKKGEWIWNLGPIKPVLYRYPELINAYNIGNCEGEKDADNLRALGFVATTCSGGAERWQPEFADVLAGKHVTIFADKDTAGEKHVEKIVQSLLPKAATVRVLYPPKGKDVSDWIAAGATKEIIEQAIANLQPITPNLNHKTTANEDLERTILSLALKNPDHFEDVSERLCADDFTDKICRIIYDAMAAVALVTSPDPVNVWAHIQSASWDKLCPREKLTEIAEASLGSLSKLKDYCKQLKEFSNRRALAKASRDLYALSRTPDSSAELAGKAEAVLAKVSDTQGPERPLVDLGEVIEEIGIDKFLNPYFGEKLIETPFADLNEIIVGFKRKTLSVIAARPSVGKSVLAAQIAAYVAEHGRRVGYFSLEMQREAVYRRLVSSYSSVSTYRIVKHLMDKEEKERVYASTEHLMTIPLYVCDTFGRTVKQVKSGIRNHPGGLDLVIIDYFQLMRGSARGYKDRRIELGEISMELKQLAISLNIALVIIASLSRASEKREDKEPQLSDLYETGQLEYDLDLALMLHRPELNKADGDKTRTNLFIRKQRDGATGKVELRFVPEFVRFESVAKF